MPTNPTDDVIERAERLLLEPIVNRMGAGERACQLVIDLVVALRTARAELAEAKRREDEYCKKRCFGHGDKDVTNWVTEAAYLKLESELAEAKEKYGASLAMYSDELRKAGQETMKVRAELADARAMIVLLMNQREWGAATGALLEDPVVKKAYAAVDEAVNGVG